MKIIFLGKGITESDKTRIEQLKREAIQNGHEVVNQNNGFVENIISILRFRAKKSNTIHVHGWNSALLLTMMRIFAPRSMTRIWTINTIPTIKSGIQKILFMRFLLMVTSSFDQICSPTRTLQYRLLAEYGIRSLYIPDGYTEPILHDIQPREYGLRNNQYGILLSQSLDTIEIIAETYKQTKSRKKLVVFSKNPSVEFKKLIKNYPFITPISLPMASRGAQSLVRTAGFVIMCDSSYSPLLLQAMDANRVIIANTNPLHEEILGTAGFYYQEEDSEHLAYLLQKATKDALLPKYSPAVRAKHHFTWEKAALEYEHVYIRKQQKLVPFDSLISRNSFQRAL